MLERRLVEARIAEKNALLAAYRQCASNVWLLMVNDLFLGPGEVTVGAQDLTKWTFDFDFDKVLLFERQPGGSGRVTELQRAALSLRPVERLGVLPQGLVTVR